MRLVQDLSLPDACFPFRNEPAVSPSASPRSASDSSPSVIRLTRFLRNFSDTRRGRRERGGCTGGADACAVGENVLAVPLCCCAANEAGTPHSSARRSSSVRRVLRTGNPLPGTRALPRIRNAYVRLFQASRESQMAFAMKAALLLSASRAISSSLARSSACSASMLASETRDEDLL